MRNYLTVTSYIGVMRFCADVLLKELQDCKLWTTTQEKSDDKKYHSVRKCNFLGQEVQQILEELHINVRPLELRFGQHSLKFNHLLPESNIVM